MILCLVAFGTINAQTSRIKVPFISGNDTISQITDQDTVYWRGGVSGLNLPAWNVLTNYVSAAEKVAETTQIYILVNEDMWTWYNIIQFRIDSKADTLDSKNVTVGDTRGEWTLFVQPDTSGTNTIYKVRFGGR